MNGKNLILHIKDLKKIYTGSEQEILNGVSLDLYEKDFLCVLGPSGCGKSTMIRCIAGFEDYTGVIECSGKAVSKPGPDRVMVFQDFGQLFPWKTVRHNIMYPLEVNGVTGKKEREAIADKYLEIVNLSGYADYYPHQLSGGMKQRVAIARGLALQPKIILMDEPFAALDAMTRNQMQSELLKIKEMANMTVIFVTHNIQEALSLGSRIMVMSRGGVIETEMENPLKKPVTPATEGYGEMWEFLNDRLTKAAGAAR